jgi:hypothetical protein
MQKSIAEVFSQLVALALTNVPLLALAAIRNRWGLDYLGQSNFADLILLISASSVVGTLLTGGLSMSLTKSVIGVHLETKAAIHLVNVAVSSVAFAAVSTSTWLYLRTVNRELDSLHVLVALIAVASFLEAYRAFFTALDAANGQIVIANGARGFGALISLALGPTLCEQLGMVGLVVTMLVPNAISVLVGLVRHWHVVAASAAVPRNVLKAEVKNLFHVQSSLYLTGLLGSLGDLILRSAVRTRYGDISLIRLNIALSVYSAISTVVSSASGAMSLQIRTGLTAPKAVRRVLMVSSATIVFLYVMAMLSRDQINYHLLGDRPGLTVALLASSLLLNLGQNISWIYGARTVLEGTRLSIILIDTFPMVVRLLSLTVPLRGLETQMILYAVASVAASFALVRQTGLGLGYVRWQRRQSR